MVEATLYTPTDFTINVDTVDGNPFMIDVRAEFTHESGRKVRNVPGFCDGDGKYIIRFSPSLPGEWKGTTTSANAELNGVELPSLTCVPNANPNVKGGVQIAPENRWRFIHEDGSQFIPLGFECDWLFEYHRRAPERCRQQVELLRQRGFNYIVMNIYAHTGFSRPDYRADDGRLVAPEFIYGPPAVYPWEGSNDAPDHNRINPAFFANYDGLMRLLHENGITAHIMVQVQNKRVNWPARLSAEDDLYWRYVVARYQAFDVVWDVGKESFNLYHETGSHGYTLNRMRYIRANDAHRRLVTVHDPSAGSAGRHCVVDENADFVSDQIHLGNADAYNREAIARLGSWPTPYLNIEYGYELGVDNLKTYRGSTTSEWQDVLRWTWSLYTAGAYGCYYYDNAAWDLIKFDPEPPGWKRYEALRQFVDALPYNRMTSNNDLVNCGQCLAAIGDTYLVYLPEGGSVQLDLSAAPAAPGVRDRRDYAGCVVDVQWMQIYSCECINAPSGLNGFGTTLNNPFRDPNQPCVLAVRL